MQQVTIEPIELLTTAEVARVLGVNRRTVAYWSDTRADFPQPYAITRGVRRTRGIRLWLPSDISEWMRTQH
jgi:predicted DNA-binding transcriptional regulator AlpA